MKALPIPTDIGEYIKYNPYTGHFYWKKRLYPKSPVLVGGRAGHKNSRGYTIIRFRYKGYRAYRVAFFLMTGRDLKPGYQIDHINRNPSDNRWRNLREVTHGENRENSKFSRNNKLGEKHIEKLPGSYRIRIRRSYCHLVENASDLKRAIIVREQLLEEADSLRKDLQ